MRITKALLPPAILLLAALVPAYASGVESEAAPISSGATDVAHQWILVPLGMTLRAESTPEGTLLRVEPQASTVVSLEPTEAPTRPLTHPATCVWTGSHPIGISDWTRGYLVDPPSSNIGGRQVPEEPGGCWYERHPHSIAHLSITPLGGSSRLRVDDLWSSSFTEFECRPSIVPNFSLCSYYGSGSHYTTYQYWEGYVQAWNGGSVIGEATRA